MSQKQPTPMQRLSQQFMKLDQAFHSIKFKPATLNQSNPQYNPLTYKMSKGVKSDHCRIYYSENRKISIAFTFTYLDLPAELHSIQVSVKENSTFLQSPKFTYDEFKEHLRTYLAVIYKEDQPSKKKFISYLNTIFYLNDNANAISHPTYTKTLENYAQELNIEGLTSLHTEVTTKYQKAVNKYKTELAKTPEAIELAQLENKIKTLQEQYQHKKTELYKKHLIDTLQKEAQKIDTQFQEAKSKYSKIEALLGPTVTHKKPKM